MNTAAKTYSINLSIILYYAFSLNIMNIIILFLAPIKPQEVKRAYTVTLIELSFISPFVKLLTTLQKQKH